MIARRTINSHKKFTPQNPDIAGMLAVWSATRKLSTKLPPRKSDRAWEVLFSEPAT